jgi:hypothetical protein
MYHDMGLIACFWLAFDEAPSTQFAASEWLMDPGMPFYLMSKYRATFSCFQFRLRLSRYTERTRGPRREAGMSGMDDCSEP